jgi:uncharacterized protein
MSRALPLFLDLAQGARQDTRLQGRIAVAELPRLAAALFSDSGVADIDLRIVADDSGRQVIKGVIEAELQLVCQRCLEPAALKVRAEPQLAWARSDADVEDLAEGYDPLVSADGHVMLADLVTDELLLALPSVPRHPDEVGCGKRMPKVARPAPAPVEDKKSPFAVLAELKRKR